MDDQHVFALIKTINRAYLNAIGVFAADTFVINDIGHEIAPCGGASEVVAQNINADKM
jgi:hypothetical protein